MRAWSVRVVTEQRLRVGLGRRGWAAVLLGGAVGRCCWAVLLGGAVGRCSWAVQLGGAVGRCSWAVLLGGAVGRWCWAVLGAPTGMRLAPVMGELVATLRRFGELDVSSDVAAALTVVSPATMDRRLAVDKAGLTLRGRPAT